MGEAKQVGRPRRAERHPRQDQDTLGRLGQAILAWFSWNAFSAYVMISMVSSPITYRTYWAIYINKEPSFTSIPRIVVDFAKRRGLPSKIAMTFMILTMVFVLAFPTLASAMTGYNANSGSFVVGYSGSLIPYSEFVPIVYVIHDGNRINLTADYPVNLTISSDCK